MVNRTKSHALAYLFFIAIGISTLLSASIYAYTNQLTAIPDAITVNSDDYPDGGPAALSFWVNDSLGDPVSFWVWNATDWLQPDTILNSPLITPDSVNYLVFFDMVEPGTHEDTIRIQADGDVGMARVIVTMIQGGYPSQAYVSTIPRFFNLDLSPGESVENISLFVYENRGYELPYRAELINNSSWLQFQGDSESGTMPDTILFKIDTEGLDTGLYIDSILIYNPLDDGSPYFEVKVPVTISVGYNLPDVYTAPSYFRFVARQSDIIADSLVVMESHGMIEPFMYRTVHEASIIEFDPAYAVIPETPGVVYFTINTADIEPGFYTDSIEIYSPYDSVWEAPVFVPIALDLAPDQAFISVHPAYFGISLYENESRSCALLVYDRLHDAYLFTASFMFASPWLALVGGPQVYTTPDSVEFTVIASLSPGIYVDTLIITSADEPPSFEPVKLPVVMTINESPGNIDIRVFPEEIDKTVIIGHEDLAGFVVYDAYNRQVEFQLSNIEAWLTVIDSGNAEYLTPHFVRYGLNAANLNVGQYNDTVYIDDVFEQARWETVKVPVRLNVVETIPPKLFASPSSIDFYRTPADSSFYIAVSIEEVHGDTLEFWPTGLEGSDWISIVYSDTAFIAPGWLLLFISPANLECRDYQDTIDIYIHNPIEENPIPDLIIPVTMHITNDGFLCGDFNYDGRLNLLDILAMIEQLYVNSAGQDPVQGQAIDFSQGSLNLLHILNMIDHLYGDPPGPPPACG
jgi:hypothetical protein